MKIEKDIGMRKEVGQGKIEMVNVNYRMREPSEGLIMKVRLNKSKVLRKESSHQIQPINLRIDKSENFCIFNRNEIQ